LIIDSFGKLFNADGEIVAEGNCQIDHEHGTVTFRPLVDSPTLQRQHGYLRLVFDDESEVEAAAERIIRFRLNVPGQPPGYAYRLFFAGVHQSPRTTDDAAQQT
jgi:hypothetical protein